MAFAYSGTAGSAGAVIYITGSETLATLKTSLASNAAYASINGNSIVFAASLSIGNGSTTGSFTASDAILVFPQAYTFTVPNNSAQSGSSTTLTDVAIIFDGTAKSYSNAINYGTHTWTRVVYRSQIATPRNDLFQNTGCIFVFNNVQLAVSSTATSYPYDFIHLYSNTTGTLQGLTISGLGGSGTANSVEIGSATGTTTTLQSLVVGGNFGAITLNNGGTSYGGTQDFRALSWPANTSWVFNYGSGGGTAYITNPNKPSGWTGYSFLSGGAGGTGTIIERYTHDITAVNSSAVGVVGVNSGDFRSGAFVWTAASSTGGVTPTQYVTTANLTGAAPGTLTSYSTSVTTAAWLYGYNTFVGGRTYTPTGVGITDTILMVSDVTTLSSSAVAALTSLATLDNLYDASRYWNTLNSTNIQVPSLGSNIITANGSQLNLGSYNLVINSGTTTAGNAFSVSGSTITIYSSSLASGTKFTSFTTTGTITVNSGVTVTAPFSTTSTVTNSGTINTTYTSSTGTSGVITLTNLLSGSTVVTDAGVATTSSGTSLTLYTPPGTYPTFHYAITKYGYLPVYGTIAGTSGAVNATIVQSADVGITQTTQATVAAYTSLSTLDQLYDYWSYYLYTGAAGSGSTQYFTNVKSGAWSGAPLSKSGTAISLLSAITTLTLSTGTITNTVATSSSSITIAGVASTLAPGATTFASLSAASVTSLTNTGITPQFVYTVSAGTSLAVSLTVPSGSAVAILNGSGAIVTGSYNSATSGTSYAFYTTPGQTGTWTYKIAKYGSLSTSNTFTPSGQVSATVSLSTDTGITQANATTVSGYTTLGTPDQLYDFAAYWQTTNNTGGIASTNPCLKVGSQLSLGSTALTLSTSASSVFAYSGSAITAKSPSTFATGATYTSFATSSTSTLTGVTVTCVYTTSAGTSTVLTLTNLPYTVANGGSYISITNNSNAQVQYIGPVTSGTQVVYIAPGAALSYSWKAACYGYLPSTNSFTTQGYTSAAVSLSTDTGITQATVATVAAYTSLGSPDQIYDYAAYWETLSAGITITRVTTKVGAQLSFGSAAVTLSTSAGNVYVATASTAVILSPATFVAGSTFTNFATTSTATLTGVTVQCVYTTSSGTATILILNVATGSSVYITNASAIQQAFTNNSGSVFTYYNPPAAAQTWNYKVAKYGYLPQIGSISNSGSTTLTITLSTDSGITQATAATVAAYTSLSSPDQIYDYAAYWETTNTGIPITRVATKIGSQLNFGSNAVTFNTSASNVYVATSSSATILSSSTFTLGITFNSFGTSGTFTNTGSATTIQCVYTTSAGTSTVLTISNLPYSAANGGSSLSIVNNSSAQVQFFSNISSGTQIVYIAPSAALSYSWKAACYGYLSATTSFTTQGYVNATSSLSADTGITQTNRSTVAAYASLTTCDKFYDYAAYIQTQNGTSGITVSNPVVKNGAQVSLGSYSLTLNTTASPIFSFTGSAITANSGSTFATGVTFTNIATTSTTTFTGVTPTCVYTNSSGTSTVLTITGLPYAVANGGTYIEIVNNSAAQVQYTASPITSGSQIFYIAPGAALSYSWKAACYGYLSSTTSFTTQGYVTNAATLSTDTGITQATRATVAGYISFSTPDQIYDFLAYWETTNNTGGIQVARPSTKNGVSVSFGTNNIVFSSTTGTTYAYAAGSPNTLTFETAATLNVGSTFQNFNTSGTVTFTSVNPNLIYTSNLGTSSNISFSNILSGSSIFIQNASNVQQVYLTGQSGTYNYPLPAGSSSGSWNWAVKTLGYSSQTGSYTPSAGGQTTIALTTPQKVQPSGAAMYTGSTNSLCTISFTADSGYADILIGNGSVSPQNVFDISENALVTTANGMQWIANGNGELTIYLSPTGNYLFMTHNWRIKALNTSCPNATVTGLPQSTDGTPLNAANGNVIILTTTQAAQVAAAVWNYLTASANTAGTFGGAVATINGGVQKASLLIPYSGTI